MVDNDTTKPDIQDNGNISGAVPPPCGKGSERRVDLRMIIAGWVLMAVIIAYYIFIVINQGFAAMLPVFFYFVAMLVLTLMQTFIKDDYMLINARIFMSIIPMLIFFNLVLLFFALLISSALFIFLLVPEVMTALWAHIDYYILSLVFTGVIIIFSLILSAADWRGFQKRNADRAEWLQTKNAPHARRNVIVLDFILALLFAAALLVPFVRGKDSVIFIVMSILFALCSACGLIFKKFRIINIKTIIAMLGYVAFNIFSVLSGANIGGASINGGIFGAPIIAPLSMGLYLIMSYILSYELKVQSDYCKLLRRRKLFGRGR